MASINMGNKGTRFFPSHPHHSATFGSRSHQIAALALVVTTFFLTRLLDHSLGPCSSSYRSSFADVNRQYDGVMRFGDSGEWPERGYGTHLDLKIYVYDENEIDGLKLLLHGRDGKISPEACIKGQWGTQWCWSSLVQVLGNISEPFNNPNSRGIVLLQCLPCVTMMKPEGILLLHLIILECNNTKGDRTDKRGTSAFGTWKDIIIPGNVDDGMTADRSRLVDPLPLSKRKYLAIFLGRAQGKVGRLQLIELAKQFPDKLEPPELKFSGPNKLGRTEYFKHLQNAKFCLAPRGESSWTLRFYESFFVECVPVILSDQVELPFQNVVDYTLISIKWPSTRIGPELLDYLESIPDEDVEGMIVEGRKVRCLWVYASETELCSAFTGILWELQKKVRQFHQSTETFWLHNGTIVNRDLVEFSKWKPPMPLP